MPYSKGNIKNLEVTWHDASDSYATSAVITQHVKGIPLFTDTGSGEVNQARILLRARDGRFITSISPIPIAQFDRIHIECEDIGSGQKYDRWFEVDSLKPSQSKKTGTILTIDCLGTEYYTQHSHFAKPFWFTDGFNVVKFMIDQYNKRKGSDMPTLKEHDQLFNSTTKVGNDIPRFTLNNYEYGNSEDTYYNRIIDITEKFGGSPAIGGVRDFYEIGWETDSLNSVKMRLFSSGSTPTSPITIEKTLSINVGEQDGLIDNAAGTVINAWGSNLHGTLPRDNAVYRSGVFQFIFRPLFDVGVTYKQNAKVKHEGLHYSSIDDGNLGNTPTGATDIFWSRTDMGAEFGDNIQKSPWTDNKRRLFMNSGANPNATVTNGTDATATVVISSGVITNINITTGGTGYYGTTTIRIAGDGNGALAKVTTNSTGNVSSVSVIDGGTGYTSAIVEFSGGGSKALINSTGSYTTRAMMFDGNLSINHENFTRDWVNETSSGGLSGNYLYDSGNHPRGYRFLNLGTVPVISGTDRNGKDFANTIVENQLTKDGQPLFLEWVVIKEFGNNNNGAQVVVIGTGSTLEWDKSGLTFTDISTSANNNPAKDGVGGGNDCFHDWKTLSNVSGFDPKPGITDREKYPEVTVDGAVFGKGRDSAIEVVYEIPNIIEGTFDLDSFYRKGAWLNFAFPYPINTFGGISESVGDLYGGGTISGTTGDDEPATLDTSNMSYTHDGLIGFNNGISSEDLGPLNSLGFVIRVRMTGSGGISLNGTATVKVTCYDTASHKTDQEFEVRFTDGLWQPTNLPLSGFSVQKSNMPRFTTHSALFDTLISEFVNLIPPTEQENTEIFEWRNLKMISFQVNNFYDEHGRYAPEINVADMDNAGLITALGGRIALAIDELHFKKPLLVNSGRDSTRGIETKFLQRGSVSLYDQLKEDVESEEEINRFQHQEFVFQTSGKNIFDVDFGDSIFLKNSSLVNRADKNETSEGANDGVANTIKLVAKRIEYSITKPLAGAGGMKRTIKGIKRFV